MGNSYPIPAQVVDLSSWGYRQPSRLLFRLGAFPTSAAIAAWACSMALTSGELAGKSNFLTLKSSKTYLSMLLDVKRILEESKLLS
jgi:hypothetical protein